jgi:hypothetical protein
LASVTETFTILHIQINEVKFGKELLDLEKSYFN